MAGDLFIMNITDEERQVIIKAGGKLEQVIYHADRGEQPYYDLLKARLKPSITIQNRMNLPPHAYITISKNDYKPNVAMLNNFLAKVSRPLGVVTNQKALAEWNSQVPDRTKYLEEALKQIKVTLEYYQYGGKNLLNAPYAAKFERVDE
jgi:hypothetical protein